jgi:hypothetical protein
MVDPLASTLVHADSGNAPDPLAFLRPKLCDPLDRLSVHAQLDPLERLLNPEPTSDKRFKSKDTSQKPFTKHVPTSKCVQNETGRANAIGRQFPANARFAPRTLNPTTTLFTNYDDKISVAIAFTASVNSVSNQAFSNIAQSLIPSLTKLCHDVAPDAPVSRIGELCKPQNIKRSRDLVAAATIHKVLHCIQALRDWDEDHVYTQRIAEVIFTASLMQYPPADSIDILANCILIVDWMWDETCQTLNDNSPLDVVERLPLTPEYLHALRSGGYAAARCVAMSVMVQMGGFELVFIPLADKPLELSIVDERCIVPLTKLGRLNAETIHSGLERWMPFSPIQHCRLYEFIRSIYFILLGDGAYSNDRLKEYLVLQRVPKANVLGDKCRAHLVNLSNHDQLHSLVGLNPRVQEPAPQPPEVPAAIPAAIPAAPEGARGRGRGRGAAKAKGKGKAGGDGGLAAPAAAAAVAKPKPKKKKVVTSAFMTNMIRGSNLFELAKTWDCLDKAFDSFVEEHLVIALATPVNLEERMENRRRNERLLSDFGIIVGDAQAAIESNDNAYAMPHLDTQESQHS